MKYITDHPKSYLERIFTDYRPQAAITFVKERGKDRKEDLVIDLEEFISIKGITAMGNQLTKSKVLEINELDPLPYEAPEATPAGEMEVVDEQTVAAEPPKEAPAKPKADPPEDGPEPETDDEGQTLLF